MSTFTFNIYLVQDIDGDGTDDYVLQDDGRIIISTQSITVDTNFRYIGGQIARKPGSRPALTFTIKKRPNNTWYLLVNRTTFCGLYSNREDCLGVLYGYYTNFSGHDDGFANWLADSLEKGSVLDPDENILTLERTGDPANDITVTLASINSSALIEGLDPADYSFGVFLGRQTQNEGSSSWSDITPFGTNILDQNDGTDLVETATGGWVVVPENGYVRPVVAAYDINDILNPTIVQEGTPLLKDDADDTDLTGLSLSISGDASAIVPVEVGGFAYALVDESGAVLDPGETITYTYDWYREIPELTGITNDASPPTTIGTVTVSGSTTPTELVAESYSVAISGDATDQTYSWTTTDGSAVIASPTAATTDITFSAAGSFDVTCTVTSAGSSDSPASDTLAVTAAAAGPTPAYEFTGDLDNDTGTRFGLTNVVESGNIGDFDPTGNSQPIRYSTSTNDSITLLIGKTGSIDHTTAGLDAKFYHDNGSGYVEFVPDVLTFDELGALLTIKLQGVGSPGTAGSFWSSMDDGESVKLELYY